VTRSLRPDGGVTGDPGADTAEVEELVKKVVRKTYPTERLEQEVDYVEVHYDQYDGDAHLLRARAPEHELLEFDRWLTVTVDGRDIYIRGAGRASPSEYYVRAKLDAE